MAVFQDYLDLRLAVSEHVGNRNISDVMKRLVQQAESNLNRQLRTMWQITDFTPVWTGDEAPLPTDFLQLVDSNTLLRVGFGTLTRRAYYTTPNELSYYASLPTITSSPAGTNWLLQRYPDVYLYASTLEAAKFLRDADLVGLTEPLLAQALNSLKIDDERARYSNVSVRVAGVTP